jgi:hypothetical protein
MINSIDAFWYISLRVAFFPLQVMEAANSCEQAVAELQQIRGCVNFYREGANIVKI